LIDGADAVDAVHPMTADVPLDPSVPYGAYCWLSSEGALVVDRQTLAIMRNGSGA
jgi:hypothetical protein